MILTACDSSYLDEAACLIRSCARYAPEQSFYLFLINDQNTPDESIQKWHTDILIDRVFWPIKGERWRGIICSARSIPIEKALKKYHQKLLYLDADMIVRGSLTGLFHDLDLYDLMIKHRPQLNHLGPTGSQFASRFNSGVIAIRPSSGGLKFAQEYNLALQNYVNSGKPLVLPLLGEKVVSYIDQELLFLTYLRLKNEITFSPLPDKYNDAKFMPDSLIWHGKGTARNHPLYRLEKAYYQHRRLSPLFTVFSSILFAARAAKRKIIP